MLTRDEIKAMPPEDCKAYLLAMHPSGTERETRVKAALPSAPPRAVQAMVILWEARRRGVVPYEIIEHRFAEITDIEMGPREIAVHVKRLRRAIKEVGLPIKIGRAHYKIGYPIGVPPGWVAPWDQQARKADVHPPSSPGASVMRCTTIGFCRNSSARMK